MTSSEWLDRFFGILNHQGMIKKYSDFTTDKYLMRVALIALTEEWVILCDAYPQVFPEGNLVQWAKQGEYYKEKLAELKKVGTT